MDDVLTQIYLLVDCINKKIEILEEIQLLSAEQTEVIINFPNDNISFEALVSKKRELINEVNDLDGIFESIFTKIKDFMGKGNIDHRQPMMELQSKILTVSEITVNIKTLEEKNMRILTGGVRKPPKKLVSTNQAVSAYKKNKKF